jgi:AcrR family transcriptional regulator
MRAKRSDHSGYWHTVRVPVTETPPRPLRRDAERNRALIVTAARDAFASDGIEVSVEEIARRASVGIATLYRRFPTKEDLIDAVLEDALAEICQAAQSALEEEDGWIGFTGFLECVFGLHERNRCLKDVIASHRHGRRRLEAARAELRPLVGELISRAQAQGTLRADLTPEDVPLLLWSGGRVAQMTSGVVPELWRRYLGLMLDGLRPSAATPLSQPPLTRAQLERVNSLGPR